MWTYKDPKIKDPLKFIAATLTPPPGLGLPGVIDMLGDTSDKVFGPTSSIPLGEPGHNPWTYKDPKIEEPLNFLVDTLTPPPGLGFPALGDALKKEFSCGPDLVDPIAMTLCVPCKSVAWLQGFDTSWCAIVTLVSPILLTLTVNNVAVEWIGFQSRWPGVAVGVAWFVYANPNLLQTFIPQ